MANGYYTPGDTGNLVLSDKCRDLHSKLVSILSDICINSELFTQALVDDAHAQV